VIQTAVLQERDVLNVLEAPHQTYVACLELLIHAVQAFQFGHIFIVPYVKYTEEILITQYVATNGSSKIVLRLIAVEVKMVCCLVYALQAGAQSEQ
jgi:hypothetical protein